MAQLHICLLDNFRLTYDETTITDIDTPRLQSFLAYLVLHPYVRQLRQRLAFLFWPDSTEEQARTNLRKVIYHLRRALPDPDRCLHADARELCWQPEVPFILDVAEFEAAVAQMNRAREAGDLAAAQAAAEQAVAVYQGDLLPGCYDDWIHSPRERLRQAFISALEYLTSSLEDLRHYQAAIVYAERLLWLDPVQEIAYRRLMRLHALNGDPVRAMRVYHQCASQLDRSLNVKPSPATQKLYEQLTHRKNTQVAPAPEVAPPLLGRHKAWKQLQAAWQEAGKGRPGCVVITGEAGIGKTRLAEELLEWAARQGQVTARATCYASEGRLPYAPAADWLRTEGLKNSLPLLDTATLSEVLRLLPDLSQQTDIVMPDPLDEPWQRLRLFNALARALLLQTQPLLLLLDDLQWCDLDTIEWIRHLLRFDPESRLLIIATLRVEELAIPALSAFLLDLRQTEQLTEIELLPLDRNDTETLAAHVLGRPLEPELAAHLYAETEGNPLFIVEVARAGLQLLTLHQPSLGNSLSTPRIQAVLEARLAQLSPLASEIAGVAATIGRAFTFDVLKDASGLADSTVVQALDELWQRRVVREQADAYDFSHDKLRQVAYDNLTTARRRLYNRRIAEALELRQADRAGKASRIATHYEQAGYAEKAIFWYHRAATDARRIWANEEVIRYYQRALSLLGDNDYTHPHLAAQLHEELGDALALTGQLDEARRAYRQALVFLATVDQVGEARLYRKLGRTWRSQLNVPEAMAAYQQAKAVLGPEPSQERPDWWQQWIAVLLDEINIHYFNGHMAAIDELTAMIEPIIEQRATAQQRSSFYEGLVMARFVRDGFIASEETVAYARAALHTAHESGQITRIGSAQFGLGFSLLLHGDLAAAERQLQKGLVLGEQSGYVWLQTVCLTYLTMIYRRRGRVEQTKKYARRTLDLATTTSTTIYIAAARANLAWAAWQSGNLTQAEDEGRQALALWQEGKPPFPFCWMAVWPLIGVALAKGQVTAAVDYARLLQHPRQQRLPDTLAKMIEQALAYNSEHHLHEAFKLAQESGYV